MANKRSEWIHQFERFAVTSLLVVGLISAGCSEQVVTGLKGKLTVNPGAVHFGMVAIGATAEFPLKLDNVGSAELSVTSISLAEASDVFALATEFTGVIPKGQSETISVIYTPTENREDEAALVITTNGTIEKVNVALVGSGREGTITAYPYVVDFGPVDAGDEEERAVVIRNDGVVAFAVTGLTVEADSGAFSAEADEEDLPTTLLAGQEMAVVVTFLPDDEDADSGTLYVETDAGALLNTTVDLYANDCDATWSLEYDGDEDGHAVCADDCDDGDETAFPGNPEVEDGADNDCNGIVDDGTDAYDDDGDGYSENDGDCNDGDVDVNPDQSELPNGVDDNCDGIIDEGTISTDDDGDGYAEQGGDCDDDNPVIYPHGPELADGLDNDCDGIVDEGTDYYDDDGDGYSEIEGDCNDGDDQVYPDAPDQGPGVDWDCTGLGADITDEDSDGYGGDFGDCDDFDATVYPGAPELEDGVDNDCDGIVDEETNAYDDDGDGFSENDGDCNDGDATAYPGATETADWVDNDCDTMVDEGTIYADDDNDGATEMGGDCDDGDPDIGPHMLEVGANGIDDDCDGFID